MSSSSVSKKYMPAWVYGIFVMLVIFLPWLKPGYLLTLDMIFTPTIAVPSVGQASFLFYGLLRLCNFVLAADLIQKLVLFGFFMAAALGAHLLIRYTLQKQLFLTPTHAFLPYIAGFFYIVNPFVYSRFMAGQLGVLLGYMLLPWITYAYLQFCNTPTKRTAAIAAALTAAIGIVSMYSLPFVAIIGIVCALLSVHKNRQDKKWLTSFFSLSAALLAAVLIVNSYWLVPLLKGSSTTATALQGFTSADTVAFATDSSYLGVLGNVLSLSGFWGNAKNLFLVPQDSIHWWILPVIVLWLFVLIGILYALKKQRLLATLFLTVTVLGAILACGPQGSIFAGLNTWLFAHLPFFDGYREPQKFVALVALGYTYFVTAGTLGILSAMRQKARLKKHLVVAPLVAGACIIGLAPLMIWGFHGQIQSRKYPTDWYALNDRLAADKNAKVLFLPWHLYIRFGFSDRVLANPAPMFFKSKTIISSDPELEGATSYRTSPEQQAITGILAQHEAGKEKKLAQELSALGFTYILVAKEVDYQKYAYLKDQPNLKLMQETVNLQLYRIIDPKTETR